MPPSNPLPTPPSSVSPLSEEAIAELERLRERYANLILETVRGCSWMEPDERDRAVTLLGAIPSLLAEVRALRAMVPTRGESIVANYPGQEWRLRMANVIAERDAALAQRDEAVKRAGEMEAERDWARHERDVFSSDRLRAERDAAIEARGTAIVALQACVDALHYPENGVHYCRWCDAKSPDWIHAEHCAFKIRSKRVEDARSLARAALSAEVK